MGRELLHFTNFNFAKARQKYFRTERIHYFRHDFSFSLESSQSDVGLGVFPVGEWAGLPLLAAASEPQPAHGLFACKRSIHAIY